jgi:hypothetical protein
VDGHFDQCKTPTDVFLEIVDQELVRHITYQSNLFATQNGKTLNLKENELLVFIGINFLMGYHQLPSIKHYWSTSEDLHVKPIAGAMSRGRFMEILAYLHVNDNSKISNDNPDKLHKLRPLIDRLNEKFNEVYKGTREVSVDESMILFKGRSTLKQYNPMKPIKRGYKLWCLGDQDGYTLKFSVYEGKNEAIEAEYRGSGLGERVVLSLTREIWGTNRIVVFDNYFASIPLLIRLKEENTLACATIRNDRAGMPQNMSNSLERGQWDYRYSDTDVGVFKWEDNKSVWLISNYHGTEQSSVLRTQKDGSKITVSCPPVVKDYNKYMGGVDLADRYRALYNVDRKSKKWWHRLFWGILDIAFVNAYVINCHLNGKMPVLDFRRMVANGLISMQNTKQRKRSFDFNSSNGISSPVLKRRKADFSVPKDMRLTNKGIHWVKFDQKRGRCEVCAKRKIQSRPHSKCSHCKVFLCVNEKKNCFAEFHEVLLE